MKAALLLLAVAGAIGARPDATGNAEAGAAYGITVKAPWTAHVSKSDPGKLQLGVSERKGSMLGVSVKLTDLAGLSPDDLDGKDRPVSFVLRREAGTITFTGRFSNGSGQGALRYDADPAYWSKIAAMGVENDWNQ